MAGWRKTLERNWLYMLAATFLSVLLWVGVSADTISQRFIPADLVIINGDRRYIQTDQEPDVETVDVLFTGREGAMLALSVARPQIVVSLDSIESRTVEIDIDPRMVSARGGRELGDVRAVSVRPNHFRLYFEPRSQKVVPVVPRIILSFADGYVMADSVRVRPGVVAVEGPESEVSLIDEVHTVTITRQRVRESIDVDVPLALPDGARLVELSTSSVSVSVAVEPRAERVFPGIPIGVHGVGTGDVRLDPSLVDVRLVGPRSAVEAVRPEMLAPRVTLSGEDDYGKLLAIELGPPAPFLRVELVPDSARATGGDGTR